MCQALQELIDYNASDWLSQGIMQGRAAGRLEGKAEGKAEGRAEGRAEGKAEGKAEGMMTMAQNMYHEGGDINFIARIAGVPISTVQEWVGAPTA